MRAGRGLQLDQAAGGVAVDRAGGGGAARRRAARRGRGRGGSGSRRSPARRSARRGRRRGGRTPRPPADPDRATNSSVSNDDADDGHPLQHLAGRRRDAADHVGVERLHPPRLVGRPAGELVHGERDASAEARRSARPARRSGSATWRRDERGGVVVVERRRARARSAPWRSMQALAGLGQRVASAEPAGGRARCTPAGRASSGRCSGGGEGWRRRRRGRRRW